MQETRKPKYEVTTKEKIVFGVVVGLVIVGVLLFALLMRNKEQKSVEKISLEMVHPNEGIVVEDPILGIFTELKVGKTIALAKTVHPIGIKVETEYRIEDPSIIEIVDNKIVGKSKGKTVLYAVTKEGKKVMSNTIEITVVE